MLFVSIPYEREGTFRLDSEGDGWNIWSYGEFQFPTNGKAHSDGTLQPGDSIKIQVFQFPTNGKAHSDKMARFFSLMMALMVSIPYEREGTFRHLLYQACAFIGISFNSLRTGRHIQTKARGLTFFRWNMSFNSLRTGRHIQTDKQGLSDEDIEVSIPYEREGTFRLEDKHIVSKILDDKVSIPYERESTFRPCQRRCCVYLRKAFQFPTNGKAHSDEPTGETSEA